MACDAMPCHAIVRNDSETKRAPITTGPIEIGVELDWAHGMLHMQGTRMTLTWRSNKM